MFDDPPWLRHRRGLGPLDEPDATRFVKRVARCASAPLIWNGSRDLVAWNLMHRVEADYAAKLTGAALVAALMKAQSQLDDLPHGKRIRLVVAPGAAACAYSPAEPTRRRR